MYNPSAFQVQDIPSCHAFMRAYPLATLVVRDTHDLAAHPLPLLLQTQGAATYLCAHVPRANPVWQTLRRVSEALVMFHGPQAYVSPTWYPSKAAHHKAVPTWNYVVVQAWGQAEVIDDAAWIKQHLRELTAQHEAEFELPWSLDDAPTDFVDQLVTQLVGLRLRVTRIEGKCKLSQNRPRADQQGVIDGLLAQAKPEGLAVAELMRKRRLA